VCYSKKDAIKLILTPSATPYPKNRQSLRQHACALALSVAVMPVVAPVEETVDSIEETVDFVEEKATETETETEE
jgi:hypothetical protein